MTYYGTIVISLVLPVEREAGTGIVVAGRTGSRTYAWPDVRKVQRHQLGLALLARRQSCGEEYGGSRQAVVFTGRSGRI